MEDQFFNDLLEYFTAELSIVSNEGIEVRPWGIPLAQFWTFSIGRASHYIGELTNNREHARTKELYFREVANHKIKFETCFNFDFKIEFHDNESITNLHKHLNKTSESDPLAKVNLLRFRTYLFVLRHLGNLLDQRDQVPPEEPEKLRRRKMTRRQFVLNLKDEDFVELLYSLKEQGFVDKRTSIDDFIHAHTGFPIENKINWEDDQHSLYLFIRSLIKHGCFANKPQSGLWYVVADIYSSKNHYCFYPEKIKHSSATKGKSYKEIIDLVNYIVELSSD